MRRLRYGLGALFFFLYGAFALAFAPLLILPVWTKAGFRRVIRAFYRCFVALAGALGLFRVDMDAATREALRTAHGRIIVMNHIALIDIVVILAHLPDSTAIAKSATLKNPVLSTVVKKMFLVNGEDPEELFSRAAALIAKGVNLVVFPQGTRGGGKLHRGAARLALALKAPILPVRIDYDPVVLDKRHPWYYTGDRTIRIALEAKREIVPQGESNFTNAKKLTAAFAAQLGITQT